VPTYQYACTECGEQFDVVQKFTDDPLTTCSACGGRLRKVFTPVGVLFKGSGFYRTDSRAKEKTAAPAKGGGDTAGGRSGSSKASPADPSKPAATAAKKSESAA
jgi:putative FmdB family regulatory protein